MNIFFSGNTLHLKVRLFNRHTDGLCLILFMRSEGNPLTSDTKIPLWLIPNKRHSPVTYLQSMMKLIPYANTYAKPIKE